MKIPIAYQIGRMPSVFDNADEDENIVLERTRINPEMWAIRWHGQALNKVELIFMREPFPSSRDDNYFTKFRFLNVEEAEEFFAKNKDEIFQNRIDALLKYHPAIAIFPGE